MQKNILDNYSYVFAFLTTEQRKVVEGSILPFLPSTHIFVDGGFDQQVPMAAIIFVGCHHLSGNKLANLRRWLEGTDKKCHVVMLGSQWEQFAKEGIKVSAVLPDYLHSKDLHKALFLCLEHFANGDPNDN